LTFASKDEHHCPFTSPKDPGERIFVRLTRLRAVAWVGMHPDTAELFGPTASVYLLIEKVGDRSVIKRNMSPGAFLLDQLKVLDEQQVV